MRTKKPITLLLAAALALLPSAALAHGDHSGDSHQNRGNSKPRSQDRNHDQNRDFHRSEQNGQNASKVHIKAAKEIKDADKHSSDPSGQVASPTPSPATTPVSTPAPVRIVGFFDLKGTVGSLADGSVTVNGQAITVSDKTRIKHGPLAAGQTVQVEGYLKSDGTFVAKEIKVKVNAQASPSPSAAPTSEPTESPTASPTPTITPTESPSPSPSPTATATPAPQYIGDFTLRGKITAINEDGSIVVNGQTIQVTDQTKTKVRGGLTVGKNVSIKGGITTDGDLIAGNVSTQHQGFFTRFWNWCRGFKFWR